MSNINLIGVSGRKRSGKNTVASIINEILAEKGKETYIEKAYAAKLKQIASILTGVPLDGWETEKDKATPLPSEWNSYDSLGLKVPITRRVFLQKLGTNACNNHLHANTWINALFMDYTPISKSVFAGDTYPKWLVTDVRFPQEVTAVKSRGGIVIRVQRPATDNAGDTHASETALDDYKGFDFYIINDGTLDELREKVRLILAKLNLI